MNKKLQDVLNGSYGNYIMPFFWLHGSSEDILREYMEKIFNCGIRAVCLESRPHPDFVGEGWWKDLDIIMEEARNRQMRVWVLDDSHFPTGFANGAVRKAPDRLKRWSLIERTMKVDGPILGCRFAVHDRFFTETGGFGETDPKEELVAVIAGKRNDKDGCVYYSELIDVTDKVINGWLYMDIPEGNYCLFIYSKKMGAASKASDYISLLEKESVKILIDTVYEPHYRRYKDDFGETFAGFFSDEPGFYNLSGQPYELGKIGDLMPLPWTDRLRDQLCPDKGNKTKLVGLFHNCGGTEREIRFSYMDMITRMYENNFSIQLGKWCEERHVEYIGHVMEDGELNSGLGPGTGHYFRAMSGQNMAGIDVVLNDLQPERDYDSGEYYHYSLPVLAASAAHQNPRMKGRAMCEIFGAFGWSEGLTLMRWMADYMLVNGINWFVPHAFSEKEFPDQDCPPHFYAHGNYPQYRHMHVLFNYMNRICHLLNGGRAIVDTAILFPAEGCWAGGYRPFGYLGKLCLQNQISYEVLCLDYLREAVVEQERIIVGKASYRFLLIDSIAYLPEENIRLLEELYRKGAHIFYVNARPEGLTSIIEGNIPVIEEKEIPALLDESRNCRIFPHNKWLRCYKYVFPDLCVYMFMNSSMVNTLDVAVKVEEEEAYICYHGVENIWSLSKRNEDRSLQFHMEKGESFLLLAGRKKDLPELPKVSGTEKIRKIFDGEIRISTADYNSQECFRLLMTVKNLEDISKSILNFSGIIRYEMEFEGKACRLELERCYEAAEVFINGHSVGVRIGYPYSYNISDFTIDGLNEIRIEVATTLANAFMDPRSMERPVEPEGILGNIYLLFE